MGRLATVDASLQKPVLEASVMEKGKKKVLYKKGKVSNHVTNHRHQRNKFGSHFRAPYRTGKNLSPPLGLYVLEFVMRILALLVHLP